MRLILEVLHVKSTISESELELLLHKLNTYISRAHWSICLQDKGERKYIAFGSTKNLLRENINVKAEVILHLHRTTIVWSQLEVHIQYFRWLTVLTRIHGRHVVNIYFPKRLSKVNEDGLMTTWQICSHTPAIIFSYRFVFVFWPTNVVILVLFTMQVSRVIEFVCIITIRIR